MANEDRPRIFLCHAREDKPKVIDLYHQLKAAGYSPWLDQEDLLPGVDWEREIRRAIRGSEFFLACLSKESIDKRGFVQKELKMGLNVLDEMPEGKIYLIPVRLEACEVPERLRSRQWVDFFAPRGFEKLKRALDSELGPRPAPFELGPRPAPLEPKLTLVPAGEFLMGSDPSVDKYASDGEQPQHRLYLPDYFIAKTPVTNAQYAAFVDATGYRQPDHWKGGKPPKGKEDHPVVYVSWYAAMTFCDWLSEVTSKLYRLPSEAEWEKAARGTDGRIYPWGNEWNPKRCNSKEGGQGGTTPVGAYPQGASPYGLLDMAGNVWEWTTSLWGEDLSKPEFKYPYDSTDRRENLEAGDKVRRVLRGGSWGDGRSLARCASCDGYLPRGRWVSHGFRVCVAS
jgi:formylglycine-generating enzyme required for sulfatase activity